METRYFKENSRTVILQKEYVLSAVALRANECAADIRAHVRPLRVAHFDATSVADRKYGAVTYAQTQIMIHHIVIICIKAYASKVEI